MQKRVTLLRLKLAVLLVAAFGLLGVMSAIAQSGGGYELTRSVTTSSGLSGQIGGGYSLNSTVGQADAQGSGANGMELFGGFWGGGQIRQMYKIWLPTIGLYIIVYP